MIAMSEPVLTITSKVTSFICGTIKPSFSKILWNKTKCPLLEIGIGSLKPVSYTHLDVYKRQTFYKAHSDKENRSLMNVTFTTPNKDLDAKFVKESIEAGMTNLKGHRSVCLLYTSRCV